MWKRMGVLLGLGASGAAILTCLWTLAGMIKADFDRLIPLEEALWVMTSSGNGVTLYPPGSRVSRQLQDLILENFPSGIRFSNPIVYCDAYDVAKPGLVSCVMVSPEVGCMDEYGHIHLRP